MNRMALYIMFIVIASFSIHCVEEVCIGVDCSDENYKLLSASPNGATHRINGDRLMILRWPEGIHVTYMDGDQQGDLKDIITSDVCTDKASFTGTTTITIFGEDSLQLEICDVATQPR